MIAGIERAFATSSAWPQPTDVVVTTACYDGTSHFGPFANSLAGSDYKSRLQCEDMCGRFALSTPPALLAEIFDLFEVPTMSPRYNIAPTQDVLTIRAGSRGREGVMMRWGLIPFWADDPTIGNRLINARAESAADKPAFRAAFKSRRCLIPADGFYEWKKANKKSKAAKQPYFIRRADRQPMAFAGLWEQWSGDESEAVESCTILTTGAGGTVKDLHDRMPVVLPADRFDRWLDPQAEDIEQLKELLRPGRETDLEAYPVSRTVNSPANDSPRCIEPAAESDADLFT